MRYELNTLIYNLDLCPKEGTSQLNTMELLALIEKNINKISDLKADFLYNAMENIYTSGIGTLCYHKVWFLFDQVIFSKGWFTNGYSIKKAEVYNADYLKVKKGKYKDHPFRTHAGRLYLGGYSDHFPVFVKLQKK